MEIQIKKAVRAGNSSAVILPRAWLNKEVRVELARKTPETILSEVIEIIKRYIPLEDVIGIYLVGSYARGEEKEESDIDILVITSRTDKEMISEGIYNILIASEKLINQKIESDLLPIGQMIKEAKPLINSSYLGSIDVKITKKNIKWYIDTTEEKLKLIKKITDSAEKSGKKEIGARVAYTLVLRIRTLHIIEKLVENKKYSNQEFINLVRKVSGSSRAYESYLSVKNNLNKKNVGINEVKRLYDYLEVQLEKIRKMISKVKDY